MGHVLGGIAFGVLIGLFVLLYLSGQRNWFDNNQYVFVHLVLCRLPLWRHLLLDPGSKYSFPSPGDTCSHAVLNTGEHH